MNKVILSIGIAILLIGTIINTSTGSIIKDTNGLNDNKIKVISDNTFTTNNGTEYWALLISNLIYYDNDNIALNFKDIYNILLDSPWWSADHIKVLQEENATKRNIIQGLQWLDSMDDGDDISFIYINTHGGHLYKDLFPYDEADGFDEFLTTFWSEDFLSLTMLRDDELNYYLNRLDSQGVCLIVDSCHAGGFNDHQFCKKTKNNYDIDSTGGKQHSWLHWTEGFSEELRGPGRVIVMASREDELAAIYELTPALTDGLRGFADKNKDGMVSAEEIFIYANPRCYMQHPTIYDNFNGELILTKANTSNHSIIGRNNNEIIASDKRMMNGFNGLMEPSPNSSIVCGYITDEKTNEPVQTTIEMEWHSNGQMEWYYEYSNDSGFYSFKVAEGSFILYLDKSDYLLDESGWLNIGENETLWVNISLIPRFPENSKICGYITDLETNESIKTKIRMWWFDGQRHFYENVTWSNSAGFYSINTNAGGTYFFFPAHCPYPQHLCQNKTYCINVGDNETLWFNFSLKKRDLQVKILKPLNALYIGDELFMPFLSPVIIGRILIEVEAENFYWSEIDKVEFYIDDVLKSTNNVAPYNWSWLVGGIIRRKHTIKVIAYNTEGDTATDEIDVWKFL